MKKLIRHLSNCITDERLELFQKNLLNRTKYLTIVLENIYQPLNASAVLRSADCFGVQDVHVIENYNEFSPDREVAMGSSNWLTIKRYNEEENNTFKCIKSLKKQGYRIIATVPGNEVQSLDALDVNKGKFALLFGTEMEGLTEEAKEMADELVTIPMYGFTESFNLSVSAAICLYQLRTKLEKSNLDWKLNDEEKDKVMLQWLRYTIDRSEIVEKDFLQNRI
jgi:tRNA (guanosine-2'-O-)-methyltransferase